MQTTDKKSEARVKALRCILWVYIIMCFIIAGLNYGYAPKAPANIARVLTWVWLIYENWVKTLFILAGAYLALRILGTSQRTVLRKRGFLVCICAAIAIHVLIPLLTGNFETYFYVMPFPWTTVPVQLLDSGSSLYKNTIAVGGQETVVSALIVYVCVLVAVFLGTLLFGRRFQCSGICLFNGFAAEIFEPVLPLIGNRKAVSAGRLKLFAVLRWTFLAIGLFFFCLWALHLLGVLQNVDMELVAKVESYKYLAGELLMMMFFWIAFVGRGYCYYCPLGTVVGLLSRMAGQKITTTLTTCIACGKCSSACPMAIGIKEKAVLGNAVTSLLCVGCGHCVDSCPTKNLEYTTKFLTCVRKKSV